MYTHNATLYPMLGVGAFMSMFWAGIVVGHELGVGCVTLLIMGLLSGCIATVGVCELQRRDGGGLAAGTRERAQQHVQSAASRAVRGTGEQSRPAPVSRAMMATPMPVGPTGQP